MPYSISLSKDRFKFSASHFTLFSKERAESLHGHNYQISLTANFKEIHRETGLAIEFSELKKAIKNLCDELDEKILLPTRSPYLKTNRQPAVTDQSQNNIEVRFNNRFYSFPEEECRLLDLVNTSSECLAHWFHKKLKTPLEEIGVQDYSIHLSESQGQSVSFRTE